MSQATLFVQTQGDSRIIEIIVPENVTQAELSNALLTAGVPISPELFVFIDEAEEHIDRESDSTVSGIRHGGRVHVTHCQRIGVTVNYLNNTIERKFPPGARVRSVKRWAVREFHIDHKDAAEHVLQICNSNERPTSDTPLHALIRGHDYVVCFDLVPEKRVEG